MSRVDKLAILGVRSFDNNRSETIAFHTPLTLIVGYNGSGKTTIIECLKYATTGDMPPNSKGGAFIHDPKMCGEKEVRAQVKLSFKSINDAKMVLTRSLQLTVKKNTRQQKTLEGQLLVVRNGERSTISSKCAELDAVMPQYLGVSKAILEYVIFCHQDESLWPMSEPGTLKKRFDEIFEALKYTKAIDNIKVLRKRQGEELSKLKLLLDQYRTDKDRGEKAKRRSDELHTEIETMRVQVEQLTREIYEITQEQARLFQTAKGFEQTLATLEMKRQEANTKQSYMDELLAHMTELDDPDEELLNLQRQYEERMQTYGQHIENRRQEYESKKAELEIVSARLNTQLTEQGRLQAEKNAYEAELEERDNTVREISLKYGMRGFDGELDSTAIDQFVKKMSKMSREQSLALERLKREYREKTSEAQDEYNGLLAQRSSLQQKRDYASSEVNELDQQILGFQRKVRELGADRKQEKDENVRLADKERRLGMAKTEFEDAGFDRLIDDSRAKLRDVEERQSRVDEEFSNANRQVADRAKLELLQKGINSKTSELQSLVTAKSEAIEKVLGANWSKETLQQDLQPIIDNREYDLTDALRTKDGISQQLSQVEAKLNLAKESIRKKQRELLRSEGFVLSSFDREDGETKTVDDYPEAAEEIEKKAMDSKGSLEFFTKYLNTAIKTLDSAGACHLCKRGFGKDEIPKIRTKFEQTLKKVIESMEDEDQREHENDLKQVREARPHYDTYLRLKKIEIPALNSEVEKHAEKKQELEDQLSECEKDIDELTKKRDEIKSLNMAASDITKYAREIQSQEEDASDLSSSLTDIGGLRTMDGIKKDREELKEEYRKIQRELTLHQSDKEKKTREITTYEGQVKDSRIRLGQIGLKLEQSNTLEKRIEESHDRIRKQKLIITEVENEIEQLAPGITTSEAKLKEVAREGADKERQQQLQANKLAQSDTQLRSIQQKIINYLDRGGLEQLQQCEEQISNLEEAAKQLNEEAASISKEVTSLEKESSSAGQTERTIAENLRYRKNKRDLEKIAEEIEELESQDAAEQRDRFQRDADVLSNKHMRLSSDKSALAGEMRSKDKQLEQLIQDFATDYADAKDKYKETLSKVHTMEGAMNDLGKYGAALDKAVMKYHTLKMNEINRIIDELWKATYRGTDVDTILIRSDNETVAKNRSYNYRVCMVKQDAEMDMRGRCSAGQRVLACIIIRLALAECFGINCGLIALDEPTTNLDSDNIKSLARSLHDIIAQRQSQANFQLIVITHDEEFLKEMKCEDYCDHYYRVSRNDRQKSMIERQSITEVI